MEQTLTEQIVIRLLKKWEVESRLDRIQYLKCKLGMEMFLINLTKIIIIYTLSFLVGMIVETLIFHCAFMAIRFFAYGAHATSSTVCTIVSSAIFIGIPYIAQIILLPKPILVLLNLVNFILLAKFAPGKTKKNYLGSTEHQKLLKRNAIIANTIILLFVIVNNNIFISDLMTLGSLTAGLLSIPLPEIVSNKNSGGKKCLS